MSRNFPDWLDAYFEYARDGFCPDRFHYWTGVSTIAGALERRVWINQSGRNTFPNLYVFLISAPGEGKTSASDIGVQFLRSLERGKTGVSFFPAQMSEAALVDHAACRTKFICGDEEKEQAAHYLYVSEAEESFKEMQGGGEITALLTNLYDCRDIWEKKTIGRGSTLVINACCNMLVGCTFSFLSRMFPEERVMGGFASRICHVVHTDKTPRKIKWEVERRNPQVRAKLLEDLQHIFNLSGQFTVTREFSEAYVKWFEDHDISMKEMRSERRQAFLARKPTNLLKLSMICAVSKSDDLILDASHWERALTFVNVIEDGLEHIMDRASSMDTTMGINRVIVKALETGPRKIIELRQIMAMRGVNVREITAILGSLVEAQIISLVNIGTETCYKLLVNPDDYL